MDDLLRPQLSAALLLRHLDGAADAPLAASSATPIDALAERLGLTVAAFPPQQRRDGTLGWLEPGEHLIFVRAGLSEPVRRFTLAHEIGHALLHRASGRVALTTLASAGTLSRLDALDVLDTSDESAEAFDGCDGGDVTTPPDPLAADETLRPGQAYSARARRENEANAFAATLLLPAEKLLALYLGSNPSTSQSARIPRQRSLRLLAQQFGVSEDALLRRLSALLLPGAPDDPPMSSMAPAASEGIAPALRLDVGQQAAAAANAPALIVAGPGTGKTSTLVGRVAHLIRERGVPADAILALTFSNKAAREMSERIQALLTSSTTPETASAPATPTVSTIHAFCGDLVRRYAPLVGLRPDFRLVGATEGYFLLRRLASQLALTHYQPLGLPGLHFPALLTAISRAKDELADPERYAAIARTLQDRAQTPEARHEAERAAEVASVYAAYQTALQERGDPDFGDLIRLAVRLLREQPDVLAEVRARYQHILVDEFQDINRAMGVLLQTLVGADGPLWAVGDADQAIYRFRGASPANLARFTTAYPAAQIHTLQRNYRSLPDVLDAAAAVAGRFLDASGERQALHATRAPHPSPANARPRATVLLATAPDEISELTGLATAILDRHGAGQPFNDQVVLCRTRRQCQRVASALGAVGIPARIVAPLLEQREIKDVLAVVSLLAEGSGAGLLRAGNLRDHSFTRADAHALLTAARAQHLPATTLLHLLARTPASGDAPVPAALAEVQTLSATGRKGLATLGAVLAELRQVPDVSTGLARYIFGLSSLGRELLSGVSTTQQRQAEGDVRNGQTALLRASSMAQLLTLARAFDDQRRLERSAALTPNDVEAAGQGEDDGENAKDEAAPPAPSVSNGVETADWPGFLDYLRVVLMLRQEGNAAADEALAGAGDSLRVLTVHASKGLEFPVVYLPGLADRRFPMQRQGTSTPMPAELSEDAALEQSVAAAHLAEEACLFYVALTRARDALVLSYAERYGRQRYRPSPFLAPIEARLGARLAERRWSGATAAAYASVDASHAAPSAAVLPLEQDDDEADASDADATRARQTFETVLAGGATGPLRPSAIETYSRCPRQYAYRYLYGLRPREVSVATLRRTLHATLDSLHQRFAEHDHSDATQPDADAMRQPLTLNEALDVFEEHWHTWIERERHPAAADTLSAAAEPTSAEDRPFDQTDAPDAAPLGEPYAEVFRRHGRRVIERSWSRLTQQPLPGMADVAPAASAETSATLESRRRAAGNVAYDQPVLVRVGPHQIEVLLDRVEAAPDAAPLAQTTHPSYAPTAATPAHRAAADMPAAASAARTQRGARPTTAVRAPGSAPVHFVRHRLGNSQASETDLRSLLYALAAEQHGSSGAPAQVYHHNLTTGQMERTALEPRKALRLRAQLDESLAGMASGDYPARPEPTQCQNCPFLFICPA